MPGVSFGYPPIIISHDPVREGKSQGNTYIDPRLLNHCTDLPHTQVRPIDHATVRHSHAVLPCIPTHSIALFLRIRLYSTRDQPVDVRLDIALFVGDRLDLVVARQANANMQNVVESLLGVDLRDQRIDGFIGDFNEVRVRDYIDGVGG